MTLIDRRTYLAATGTATAGLIGLAGCSNAGAATGTLATRVTDQPGDIGDFESCIVTIQGIWVKPGDGDADDATEETATGDGDVDESAGRAYHELDDPQDADLVELQDGTTQLLDERALEAGGYRFLQLDVTNVEGVLADGGEVDVDTPGDAPLQFKELFEVREDQTTTFTADFTPVRRGQTGRYLLQPVAAGTQVEYGEASDGDAG